MTYFYNRRDCSRGTYVANFEQRNSSSIKNGKVFTLIFLLLIYFTASLTAHTSIPFNEETPTVTTDLSETNETTNSFSSYGGLVNVEQSIQSNCTLAVDAGADQTTCDGQEITLTATASGASNCVLNSCCTREVSNTDRCERDYNYALFLTGSGGQARFAITANTTVNWIECEDGTINYTVDNLESIDGTGETISLDYIYSGRTEIVPADGNNAHECESNFSDADWVYYTELTGTITSNQNGSFTVSRRGTAFQVGTGANATSTGLGFGASGWFFASGSSRYDRGDVNIMLSPECTPQGGVELFTDCGFNGTRILLGEGDYSRLANAGIPNNTLSSLRIPLGYRVVLYEGTLFRGASIELTADDNCLDDNPGFANTVSSARIFRLASTSAVSYAWSTGATTPSISVNTPGTFTVTVTDCNGCMATDRVVVRRPDADGDGVCDVDDCRPNDAAFPGTPGASCSDGKANTENDVIGADGCTCAGTPIVVDPCANKGGDSDGDGVCNLDDCQPNNANVPATPGASCNDGNANTKNDVYSADGCTCAGTPVVVDPCANKGGDSNGNGICDDDEVVTPPSSGCEVIETCGAITVKQSGTSIIIENLDGQAVVQVFNAAWSPVFSCAWWGTACEGTTTIDGLTAGDTYIVKVADCALFIPISGQDCGGGPVAPVDPCANKGGDSDGDGICNADDCQPNNASFPGTPGASCNDGNANTKNDVISANGCSCAGTPVVAPPVNPGSGDCEVLETCGAVTIKQSGTSIIIENLDGQAVVQIFTSTWSPFFNCAWWGDACEGTTIIEDLVAGDDYIVRVGSCTFTIPISGQDCGGGSVAPPVDPCANKGGDANGNGICDDDEVAPPVDPCANRGGDANGNGICDNDEVAPPVDPCANKGGDANGNGICDNDEVAPPINPGSGDCEVLASCGATTITQSGTSIIFENLSGSETVRVHEYNWATVFSCASWDPCEGTTSVDNLEVGTKYRVKIDNCVDWIIITISGSDCSGSVAPVDPCANRGGDANGNGICDDDEVAPPVDPCANRGGDANGNGICDNDEVAPPVDPSEEILVDFNTCQEPSNNVFNLGLQSRASCIGANTTNIMPNVTDRRITSCQDLNPGAGDGETFLLCFNPDLGHVFTDIQIIANTSLSRIDLSDVLASSEFLCDQSGNLFPFTVEVLLNNNSVYRDSRFITNRLTDFSFDLSSINVSAGSTVRVIISADNGNFRDECGIVEFSGLTVFGSCSQTTPPVDPGNDECEVLATCGDITVKQSGNAIIFENLNGSETVAVHNFSDWAQVFSCASWGNACQGTTVVDNLTAGAKYRVKIGSCDWMIITVSGTDCGSYFNTENTNITSNRVISTIGGTSLLTQKETAKTSLISKQETTVISEINKTNTATDRLSIFPNPAFNTLNVVLPYIGQKGQLQLLNAMGQSVSQLAIDQIDAAPVQMDVEQLNAGLYYLQVQVDGELMKMEKVIIKEK